MPIRIRTRIPAIQLLQARSRPSPAAGPLAALAGPPRARSHSQLPPKPTFKMSGEANSPCPAPALSTPPLPGSSPSASAAAAGRAAPAPSGSGLSSGPEGGAAPATPSSQTQTQNSTAVENGDGPSNGAIPPKPLPALPSPDDSTAASTSTSTSTSGEGDAGVKTLSVNGQPLALDALGPMVVNRDGTLSRVANWGEMTAHEREATLRVLGKRNQLRLGELRASGNGAGGGGSSA